MKGLLRRLYAAKQKGLLHTPESKQIKQELDKAEKEFVGAREEAFDEVMKILEVRFGKEESKLKSTLKKRFPYICRVEDCPVCRKSRW